MSGYLLAFSVGNTKRARPVSRLSIAQIKALSSVHELTILAFSVIMVLGDKMTWPIVTITIITFSRTREIRLVIDALRKHIKYPPERLRWHVADDGSPHSYLASIEKEFPFIDSVSITNRRGWGANVNAALRSIRTEYVYSTEDDYTLQRDLDLSPYVALMEAEKQIGLMRFGIVGHGFACQMHETDIRAQIPDYQENDSNRGYTGAGKLNWWEIVHEQPRGPFTFYRYSNRPHLKHRRFHDFYGMYPEGLSLGATENAMNHQIKDCVRKHGGGPLIACPANFTLWHYDHIGESRQGTGEDVHER